MEHSVAFRKDVVVQDPFRLSATIATAHGTTVVLESPEEDEEGPGTPSAAGSQVGSPRGPPPADSAGVMDAVGRATVLPVGVDCVLSAHLRVTAPCEVRRCGVEVGRGVGLKCGGVAIHSVWGGHCTMLEKK